MGSYPFACLSKQLTTTLLCRSINRFDRFNVYSFLKVNICHDSKHKRNDIHKLLDTYEDLQLVPHVITKCEFGKSFTKTTVEQHIFQAEIDEENKKKVRPFVNFKSLYQEGFNYLHMHANGILKVDTSNPLQYKQLTAFLPLHKFLTELEHHERCLKRDNKDILTDKPEAYVAVLLTNHLLSNLVPGNEYIISNDFHDKPLFCPCFDTVNCGRKMKDRYGPTGLGYEKLWYGRPDVLLFTDYEYQPCVMVREEEHSEEEDSGIEENIEKIDICEMKRSGEAWSSQAIAQCITFAFYQANVKICMGTLIPSLVLTPNKFFVYMYDYDNDVLLSSGPSPIFDYTGENFRTSAILQIWMILNHLNFVPELTVNQVKYLSKSANFHNNISSHKLPLSELSENISFKSYFKHYKKEPEINNYPEYSLE